MKDDHTIQTPTPPETEPPKGSPTSLFLAAALFLLMGIFFTFDWIGIAFTLPCLCISLACVCAGFRKL